MKTWEEYYSTDMNLQEYLGNLRPHSTLFEEIILEKPSKLLEMGVGTGSMSIFLSHLGFTVIGADNNEKVINKASKLSEKLNGKVEFVKADAYNLVDKFGTDYFDIIFSQGFFEHFDDEEIVKLINEQLKVGKVVFISVPSNFYPRKDLGNERLLSVDEWKEILDNANIQFDYIKYYGRELFGIKPIIINFIKQPKFPIAKPGHVLIKIKK